MSDTNRGPRVLDVPADWVLPRLGKRVVPPGGSIRVDERRETVTFYDTAAGDLAALDVTLHRVAGAAEPWTVGIDGTTSEFAPAGRGVPVELRDLLLGVRAGAALRVSGRAEVTRTVHRVLAEAGAELGTVSEVAVTRDGAPDSEHYVEVAGWDGFADAAVQRLCKADAVERVPHDHDVHDDALGGAVTGSVGAVLLRYLRQQRRAVLQADLDLRGSGADPDVDADTVHAFRVAIRRVRSALRVVTVADRDRVTALDGELRWLSHALGAVRDVHVLREHLTESLATLAERGDVEIDETRAAITDALDAREAATRAELTTVLAGRRYLSLLRSLRDWCDEPPFDAAANEPEQRLARYVRAAAKDLDKRLSKAGGSARRLHQARKAAKRARYVASFAGASAGPHGKQVAKRAKALQNDLGDHQDSVLAADFVAGLVAGAATSVTGDAAFGCGVLWSYERARADAALRAARKNH